MDKNIKHKRVKNIAHLDALLCQTKIYLKVKRDVFDVVQLDLLKELTCNKRKA